MNILKIYTDGACSGNQNENNVGGWGAVLEYGPHQKGLFGGERNTTNNRMELLAAVTGLELLNERCHVTLYSDSKYVVDAIEKGWAVKWRANGWMRNKKDPALNPDLWERLLALLDKHEVNFVWVKGHAGHPENERCDRLAVQAAQQYK